MKSSAAVYNRLEIAAKRLDRRPLYAWLMRRTDDAVRDVIARTLTHKAEYRYGAQNRPPGYGSAPKDILRVDPPIPGIPQTRHGVVVYARPLTDEEVRGYELAPYVPLADIVARLMARVDRYGAQYADRLRQGDTATLRSGLQGAIEEPFFTDIPHGDLWGVVADALLAKYPAAPVAPAPVKAPTWAGGFDSFDDEEEEPAPTWQDAARMALTAKMGEGEVTPVSSFLRDGETLAGVESLAYRFDARVSVHELDRVVLLFAPGAASEATADKIVAAFRRKLVPRTKATNAAWFAHLARIVVAGPAGSWNFDAEPDPTRAPRLRGEGDTVTAQKERLIMEAQRAFGRGVTITGNNEKGYTLHISPTTKKHKWAAASLRFGHDFDNAHRQLAEAIRRVSEKIPQQFPVQGFAGSTLDAEADGLRDFPDEDDGDEDNAAIRAVVRAYEAGKRKALVVSRAEADAVIAGLTVLANAEDEQAEAERKRPASKRDPERARMTRAASDGLSALSTRIFKAFR